LEIRPGETSEIEISVSPKLALEGVVRTPNGKPAVAASVDVYASGERQMMYSLPGRAPDNFTGNSGKTDQSGKFKVAGLEAGKYRVRITADGQAPLETDVWVSASSKPSSYQFAPEASCEVALTDEGLNPLANKIVIAETSRGVRYSASTVT